MIISSGPLTTGLACLPTGRGRSSQAIDPPLPGELDNTSRPSTGVQKMNV